MKISNKTYDILKAIAQYILPAIATLYFTLASIWNLPYVEQVLGTLTVIDGAIGALIGIASKTYSKSKDGTLHIDTSNPEKDTYNFELDIPLEELANRNSLNLKVNNVNTDSQE